MLEIMKLSTAENLKLLNKDTLSVIYLKMENCNEAMNQEFSDLKARSKVGMIHFEVKMTGVCYF